MKMAWYFVQTLMGCIGSVGFAVLFNIRGRKLLLFAGEWSIRWAEEHNEGLKLSEFSRG